MTTPRTIAGQAALSALRPHLKRALGRTIVAIEDQAIAPYLDALRAVDQVLEDLAGRDASSAWDRSARGGLVARAEAARQQVRPLLAQPGQPSQD